MLPLLPGKDSVGSNTPLFSLDAVTTKALYVSELVHLRVSASSLRKLFSHFVKFAKSSLLSSPHQTPGVLPASAGTYIIGWDDK